MLAFSNSIDSELYIIYGLVGLVIILIIAIIIIDRIEKKKEKKSLNRLSDTMQLKPLTEEMALELEEKKEERTASIPEVKIEKEVVEEYKEDDLEKTQAQIRVEEINNALKEAGVDDEVKENPYDKYDSFEQEQEKNAIISYEELMNSYDKLYEENEKNQYVDDDTIPINIKELYELSEQEKKMDSELNIPKVEVEEDINNVNINTQSTFKNSPYISPVYGIEQPNDDPDLSSANQFLSNLKELKSNLE